MADFNPFGRYDENTFVNPVYEDPGAAGGYDPSEAWKYKMRLIYS